MPVEVRVIRSTVVSTTSTAVISTAQDVLVLGGVSVVSTMQNGIMMESSGEGLTVLGTVFGFEGGVILGASGISGQTLTVGADGTVMNGNGAGSDAGVQVNSSRATLFNHGLISGSDSGILFSGGAATISRLFNDGIIESADSAVVRTSVVGTEQLVLVNEGTIRGGTAGLNFGSASAVEVVRNRGTIDGGVSLGGDNDTFDNRFGLVFGAIGGGSGDDVFLLGAGEELISAGTGIDTLDVRAAGGLTVSLANEILNTGLAEGDSFISVENIRGSQGNDRFMGNTVANTLQGYAGDDWLRGGLGLDRLEGGLGDDAFALSAGGAANFDTILDFGTTEGDDDRIELVRSGLGLSLAKGALQSGNFQSGASNTASDADNFVIVRTLDNTIWIDADGIGGNAPVQVADLLTSATLTVADFGIV